MGPGADLTIDTYLLRRVEHRLAGANWQRAGGKGQKPKPVVLPGEKAHVGGGKSAKQRGADAVMRLQNLGLVGQGPRRAKPQPAPQKRTVTTAEFWQAVHEMRGTGEQ